MHSRFEQTHTACGKRKGTHAQTEGLNVFEAASVTTSELMFACLTNSVSFLVALKHGVMGCAGHVSFLVALKHGAMGCTGQE